jgi:sialate O-acetylesterase
LIRVTKPNFEKERAVISYTHLGGGLVSQGEVLKGFILAGADGKFLPALAKIEGNTVIVSSEQVPNPIAVRYGWAMMADGNLFNREGLPAAPFRSDSL